MFRTLITAVLLGLAPLSSASYLMVGGGEVENPVAINQAADGSSFTLTADPCQLTSKPVEGIYRAVVFVTGKGLFEACWRQTEDGAIQFVVQTPDGLLEGEASPSDFTKISKKNAL